MNRDGVVTALFVVNQRWLMKPRRTTHLETIIQSFPTLLSSRLHLRALKEKDTYDCIIQIPNQSTTNQRLPCPVHLLFYIISIRGIRAITPIGDIVLQNWEILSNHPSVHFPLGAFQLPLRPNNCQTVPASRTRARPEPHAQLAGQPPGLAGQVPALAG